MALTIAPSRRAVAMAWSPATPAPITSTRAGGTVPAAVIMSGMARSNSAAASMTALYPARFDCEESTSIAWARVTRGSSSREKVVSPAPAKLSSRPFRR